MTDPELERLAREAGDATMDGRGRVTFEFDNHGLVRFAALIEARQERAIEVLRGERDHARACMANAVRLLTGIHSLLYPAPIKTADGRTMVFRPTTLDPHEVLQELSDRIRALPDEVAKLAAST